MSRYSLWTAAALAAIVAIGVAAIGAGVGQQKATIGQSAPDFSLQNYDGTTVKLSDLAGKVVVMEWVNPGCPFVQRHYKAGTMKSLATKYKDQGVVWLSVNSLSKATNDTNKQWASAQGLSYPVLNDSQGQVGRAYGAKTTPHMFIIDPSGKLVYEGAIDDDPSGKNDQPVNYVAKALGEILSGQPVSVPQTKSYGCSVKYQ